MRNKRRIVLGVVALSIPLATMTALGQPAFAKAPPNPVNCTGLGATVNFAPPGLSAAGQTESSKAPSTVTVTGGSISNCTLASNGNPVGGGSIPTLSINAKPTKVAKHVYSYDTCSSFASEGPSALKKALKHLTITVGGNTLTFKTKSDSEVVNGNTGEVGFQLNGQVKGGAYPDQSATIVAYLGNDTGPGTTNNFGTDFVACDNGTPGITIATASIDPATSSATL